MIHFVTQILVSTFHVSISEKLLHNFSHDKTSLVNLFTYFVTLFTSTARRVHSFANSHSRTALSRRNKLLLLKKLSGPILVLQLFFYLAEFLFAKSAADAACLLDSSDHFSASGIETILITISKSLIISLSSP